MWEFLKIVFLGGSTVLTPQPIDVSESWVEINLSEPLEALTSGAAIEIELSNLDSAPDAVSRMAAAKRLHPNNCVQARLVTTQGSEIQVAELSTAASSDSTFLVLSRKGGIPTDGQFSRVMLRATCELKGVTVSWRNYRK